jgi:hypothetical protein
MKQLQRVGKPEVQVMSGSKTNFRRHFRYNFDFHHINFTSKEGKHCSTVVKAVNRSLLHPVFSDIKNLGSKELVDWDRSLVVQEKKKTQVPPVSAIKKGRSVLEIVL